MDVLASGRVKLVIGRFGLWPGQIKVVIGRFGL